MLGIPSVFPFLTVRFHALGPSAPRWLERMEAAFAPIESWLP